MNQFIENWLKDHALKIIIWLLGLLGLSFIGIVWLFYLIQFRFPDVVNTVDNLKSEQKESLREAQTQIAKKLDESSKALGDNFKKQDDRIIKVEGNVLSLRVNLISLMQKVGKAPSKEDLKDLLSSAHEFGEIKSSSMKEVKYSNESDKLPTTQRFEAWAAASSAASASTTVSGGGWARVAIDLGLSVPNEEITKGTQDPKYIQAVFTRSLVSDNPHWEVNDNKLQVKYSTGSLLFTPKNDVSPDELQKLATDLNGVKDTLSTAPNWAMPKKGAGD